MLRGHNNYTRYPPLIVALMANKSYSKTTRSNGWGKEQHGYLVMGISTRARRLYSRYSTDSIPPQLDGQNARQYSARPTTPPLELNLTEKPSVRGLFCMVKHYLRKCS
jgi:hypothetical protein